MTYMPELEKKLHALKIPGTVSSVSKNDFYTSFYVTFDPSITLNKIRARKEDIALFFGAPVEIETERGTVVLKVATRERAMVSFSGFSSELARGVPGFEIPFAIGKSETGNNLFFDLVKMPHMIAGGATGSGKSVFIHNCILSALYSGKCNLVLIDVKQVEFSIYEGLPHLAAPICYDTKTALTTLKNLCCEMDSRYKTLKKEKCRNIQEYRNRGGKMNYICVFIDETADLVLSNKKIESYLVRIAQVGRAAGIHLILATQRPDSVVLSGLIRANIPTRACFAVQKAVDSRIILDMSGGEKLRGAGDGLFLPIGNRSPLRFQAPYISTSELINLVNVARHVND